MKKIYLSLAGLILCGSIISQNVFNMQDHIREKGILPTNVKAPVTNSNSNRAAGPFRLWVEPIGDIMANKGLDLTSANPNQDLFVDMVYQDSTVKISSPTSTRFVSDILIGTILDPKSTLLQANNDPIVSKNDAYSIDSLIILGSYVKKTAAVDTLYTWLVWGDSSNTAVFNKRLDNATWNAPIGTWRHSILGPKISGAAAAVGNKVGAAAPAGNKMLVKYVLTNTDSVSGGGRLRYITIALPTIAAIPAGNIVSCFYTFVPGGTHATGDCAYAFTGSTVPQTVNGFCGAVWGQTNPVVAALADYQDHQVDAGSWCMGATYDKKSRHNFYPTTYSTFMVGDLLTAPVIYYSIFGTASVGVKELENNAFALGQNTPNPFTNLTKINYQIKKVAENVTLQVYDIRGVKMLEKTQTGLQKGNYSVEINSVNYPAGIYFYTLTVDGNKVTRKMIVSK